MNTHESKILELELSVANHALKKKNTLSSANNTQKIPQMRYSLGKSLDKKSFIDNK